MAVIVEHGRGDRRVGRTGVLDLAPRLEGQRAERTVRGADERASLFDRVPAARDELRDDARYRRVIGGCPVAAHGDLLVLEAEAVRGLWLAASDEVIDERLEVADRRCVAGAHGKSSWGARANEGNELKFACHAAQPRITLTRQARLG